MPFAKGAIDNIEIGVVDGGVVKVTQVSPARAPTLAFVDVHELHMRVLLPGNAHTEPAHATKAYCYRQLRSDKRNLLVIL
jgi:hypothetical protein